MKKDELLKSVLSKNDRFSDIINNFMFNGKNVIKEENLSDLNIEYDFKEERKYSKKLRDLLKRCIIKNDKRAKYVIFGIENQITYDKYMVLRCLMYDALEYKRQIENDEKIKPVITLVIYYGKTKWKNKKLSDIIKIEDYIYKYINDYKINVLSVNELDELELKKYNLDNRQLFKTIKTLNNKEELNKLKEDNDFIKVNKDMANAISYLLNIDIEIEGDDINMCKALEELKQDWKQEGILLGKEEGKAEGIAFEKESNIKTMYKNGASIDLISKLLEVDKEEINFILSK